VQTTSSLEDFGRLAGGAEGTALGMDPRLFELTELLWLRLETLDSKLSMESDKLLAFDLARRQQLLLSLSIWRRASTSDSCKPWRAL